MAEKFPQPDLGTGPKYLGEQLREESIPNIGEIVYADGRIIKAVLPLILKQKAPNTGVISKRFETYINLELKDGQIYAEGSHYEKKKVLGKGAFGTVYECRDKTSDIPFVSKRTNLSEGSQQHYKSLEREVSALLLLEHGNIIILYGIIQRRELIVDVLLEPWGSSLKAYLNEWSPTRSDVVLWFYQLLLAVIFIHRKGLVHCDIHLGNILILGNWIKLCDFGSAKREGEDLFTESHGNTPCYFPPTVLKHYFDRKQIQVSPRLDTFAVGKLLLEVLIRSCITLDEMKYHIHEKEQWNNFVKSKIPEDTPEKIQSVITGLMSYTTSDGITAAKARDILRANIYA